MAYETYWVKRADARMADIHAGSDQTILEIKEAYEEAISQLNKDIDRLFYRYAGNNGLSAEEAKDLLNERLTSSEVKKIRSAIDDISDPEIKESLMAKLNATVSRARITRLEALKEDIYIQMSKMADVELTKSTARYMDILQEEYLHNVFDCQQYLGYAYSFSKIPVGTVQEILKDDWSGKHYSKRIWGNALTTGARIEDTVKKLLLKGTLTGTNSRKLASELDKLTNAGMYACERLIRTESTYFTAMADLEAAKERGTKKLKFVATLDDRTSPQCREADGTIINIEDAIPGKNIPPLHPYCRSVIIDVIEGLVHKVRRARDPETGKNYMVPADMTYSEWKKTLVDSGKILENRRKPDIMSKDKAQDIPTQGTVAEAESKENPVADSGNGFAVELTEGEERALNDYVSFQSYTLNEKLRSGEELTPTEKEMVENLDSALEKFPEYEGDLTRSLEFYRDEDVQEFLEKYQEGAIVTEAQYLSTTKGTELHNPSGQVQIVIQDAKHGKDISSVNSAEQEVLYPRNATIRVIKQIKDGDLTWIQAKEEV